MSSRSFLDLLTWHESAAPKCHWCTDLVRRSASGDHSTQPELVAARPPLERDRQFRVSDLTGGAGLTRDPAQGDVIDLAPLRCFGKRRIMRKSIEAFEFEHDGRTYICTPEARAGGKKEMWWWFRVSGDAQRYAPFEVVAGESKDAVAKRIVTWHATMLERRSAPAVSPQAWWQRRKQAASE